MRKSLALQVDKSSWDAVPPKFRKTYPFSGVPKVTSVNFLRALLWVGVSSVPVQMPLWWLASKWAIVRYIAAADHSTNNLRLHISTDNLDSHHKTILSDDWGVGIALQWLNARMRYKYVVHGAIAMEVLRTMKIARYVGRKKVGPFKCPDFFAVDRMDKIQLIECKGNQEGPTHIDRQFERGRQQKTNIRFVNESLISQRLLAGVAIANPNKRWSSTIKVADPPPGESVAYYSVEAQNPVPLIESFRRVILIQGLISAGAIRAAHTIFPQETRTSEARILHDPPTSAFETNGEKWIGQVYEELFPVPIELTDRSSIGRCRMRVGVGARLLDSIKLERGPDSQEIVRGTDLELKTEKDLTGTEENYDNRHGNLPKEERVERYASIQFGNAFVADLELLER
jgi:hypothetical protein